MFAIVYFDSSSCQRNWLFCIVPAPRCFGLELGGPKSGTIAVAHDELAMVVEGDHAVANVAATVGEVVVAIQTTSLKSN